MTPFFSVIIPLYNKEHYIEDTLNSVLIQTFKDFEVIIVDDGSTDDSFTLASAFKDNRIRFFKQKNSGATISRNLGIEHAKSKYIALLDADDTWYENHLSELKKQIDLFPEAGLYCNNYDVFLNSNTSRKTSFNFKYDNEILIVEDIFKASITDSVAWTSAIGFSKIKFNKIGGYDPNLEIAEDLDLWIRFALNYKVSFNPKITMSYKLYVSNSLSKNEDNTTRYKFVNNYPSEEKKNPSLKQYLDINRYAVALRCKMNNDHKIYKKLRDEIDYSNLNFKQRVLLMLPRTVLKYIKSFQVFLIKNNIYLTAHK